MSDPFAHRPAGLTPLLRQRYSPRVFTSRSVTPAEMERLFEAARWSPSCFNGQPWHFLYAHKEDADAFVDILSTLVPFNQAWSKSAAVLGIAVARDNFATGGKPNGWSLYDTGQAMAQMAVQAVSEGLAIHQMGGFDPAKVREVLGVPVGFTPIAAFAVGEPGDVATLPPALAEKEVPSQRRPASEFVFRGKWPAA
jgi:nitroreductase